MSRALFSTLFICFIALAIGVAIYGLRNSSPAVCNANIVTRAICNNGPAFFHSFAFATLFGVTFVTRTGQLAAIIAIFLLVTVFEASQRSGFFDFYQGRFDWLDVFASFVGCVFAYLLLSLGNTGSKRIR